MKLQSKKAPLKFIFLFILIISSEFLFSQVNTTEDRIIRIGINYGSGSLKNFLFSSGNYTYDTKFYKFQINYCLSKKRKWEFALNIEPSIYLNNYHPLELNESFDISQNKRVQDDPLLEEIKEFALNFGLQIKYLLAETLDTYFLVSLGPTFNNNATDRLNSGLSFSDILALGINYNTSFSVVDLRLSFRHVSNASLYYPNRGYNSLNFEVGITLPLKFL